MKNFKQIEALTEMPKETKEYYTDKGLLRFDLTTKSFYKDGSPMKIIFWLKEVDLNNFEEATEYLIKYLAENHNPHTSCIVTSNTAELFEGIKSHLTDKYLLD